MCCFSQSKLLMFSRTLYYAQSRIHTDNTPAPPSYPHTKPHMSHVTHACGFSSGIEYTPTHRSPCAASRSQVARKRTRAFREQFSNPYTSFARRVRLKFMTKPCWPRPHDDDNEDITCFKCTRTLCVLCFCCCCAAAAMCCV